MNKELLIAMIGFLLLGIWFTHTGYFDKPKKGEAPLNGSTLLKARIWGPFCLFCFLFLLFKLLFGE